MNDTPKPPSGDQPGTGAAAKTEPVAEQIAEAVVDSPPPAAERRVPVPPWVQLVGLPLLLVFAAMFAMAASRAVIIFMVATLIALLLNPIVRRLNKIGVPRAIAVFFVFGLFSFGISVLTVATVDIVVDRAEVIQDHLPEYYAALDDRVDSLQETLDDRGWNYDLRDQGDRFVEGLQDRSSEITRDALDFGQEFVRTTAEAVLSLIAVVVITIYMLLDAPRIGRVIAAALPQDAGVGRLFPRLERALFHYMVGQTLASLVMGASATLGIYLLGVSGLWEGGKELAIVFGLIVAVTEFAPSIGPIIGAIPPIVAAAVDGVVPALAVLIFFIALHQIEGHIVIPKLMGAAIAVHPLLVIFGILAGAQILGIGGILLALPLLAVARELAVFVRERFELGAWPAGKPLAVPAAQAPPEPGRR